MDTNLLCILVAVVAVVAACTAEAPQLRQQRFRGRLFARQEAVGQQAADNSGPYPAAQAPYPAAGYRPDRAFNLPTEDRQAEQDAVIPAQTYGAPSQQYGGPREATTPEPEDESSREEPSDESEFEAVDIQGNQVQRLTEGQDDQVQPQQQGLYYVQLPNGLVQQVALVAQPAAPQLLANLQLQPLVQAQPVVLDSAVAPKAFAYTSQYQTW